MTSATAVRDHATATQGKDRRGIGSRYQLAACDCSSGRQGRSSRLALGSWAGGGLAGSAARVAGIALPLVRDGRRVGAANVWVLPGGLAPPGGRHRGGELVTGRGRIREDDRFSSPDAPGRQEDNL
jgi:hypothetical protein